MATIIVKPSDHIVELIRIIDSYGTCTGLLIATFRIVLQSMHVVILKIIFIVL